MNRALFLDRDGVVNVEKNYVHRIKDFEFVEGIFELTMFLQSKGYLIFIITNQAGIARGYYTEEDFRILNDWMLNEFIKRGCNISKVYFCPHHPVYGLGKYKIDCECRKPKPGMILLAKDEFNIDLEQSILIGNSESDMEAGINAGIVINYLLADGSTNVNEKKGYKVVKNLLDIMYKMRLGLLI